MKKSIEMVNLIWRLPASFAKRRLCRSAATPTLAINPDDDWIWYEVSKTLYTQMGGDLRIGLT